MKKGQELLVIIARTDCGAPIYGCPPAKPRKGELDASKGGRQYFKAGIEQRFGPRDGHTLVGGTPKGKRI